MSASKRPSFSINPLWPHYGAFAALTFGLLVGFARFFLDPFDPLHCNSLLNHGSWLDDAHRNWQPEGCMLHSYKPQDASTCLASRQVVFIGDSVTRLLFFQFGQLLDSALPTGPPNDDEKHSDHSLRSKAGTRLDFYWDPYLNASRTRDVIASRTAGLNTTDSHLSSKPSILILGSGLWYLRYLESGGLPAWEANIEATLDSIMRAHPKPADEIVILPIEEVVPSKLSRERASSMRSSDIDAMNSDLFHRIHLPLSNPSHFFARTPVATSVSLPMVFNKMLDSSQTEDGLHFSETLIKAQANILLNLRCNDILPKKFPLDKTCCRSYPWPSALQMIILGVAVLWGPYLWFLSYRSGKNGAGRQLIEEHVPALVFSAAIALIYVADRTGFWLKEQKQFNPWTFTFLGLSFLAFGLVTVKRADKDPGFLNRDQTDEWKGWMQIAILVYHYLGASKISGIYNPIRVLVAAYLFMTGYGHTTFYIRKADFGFLRVAQVMVRLNILSIVLSYTMNTDYISYYFAPLVSMWFLIIYATMAVGSRFNERTPVLVIKILLSMALVTGFMSQPWLLEILFEFLERVFGIHWSAREWAFRVNLDLWIVYFGMFASIAVIKIREHRLTDHPHWPLAVKTSVILSSIVTVWYFAFELWQADKFVYNGWHPYISFLPISAFVALRNANPIMRSASSRAFAFIGTCSLETFIIQYHFWLAGDTKGVLLVIPGTRWRPFNFVIMSIMFIYVSHRVAQASGDITSWICGGAKKTLPTTTADAGPNASTHVPTQSTSHRSEEAIPLTSQAEPKDDHSEPPTRPVRRWVDRLADDGPSTSSSSPRGLSLLAEWTPGMKTKLAVCFAVMWLANILWTYP